MDNVKDYLAAEQLYVGLISVDDGLVDVTDPCYEEDTWCAIFGKQIKSGHYGCYVDIWNFPYESNVISKRQILNDYRVSSLTILHRSFPESCLDEEFELVNTNIGVDAGLCGFYNHKPSFKKDSDWDSFWQNLSRLLEYRVTVDNGKANGITVSSGFGDGCYSLYQLKKDDEVIALKLVFIEDDEEDEEE